MTISHFRELFFERHEAGAKKRLQKLRSTGLINRRDGKKFDQAVFFLGHPGLSALRDRGILAEYPAFDLPALTRRASVSELTLRHELEVMDVKVAVSSALEEFGFKLLEFTTWPLLIQFDGPLARGDRQKAMVKPDGLLRIVDQRARTTAIEHAFYFEIDRSTEKLAILVSRANQYLAHYRSGGFAARKGVSRSEYRNHPFRVLFVLKTAERRNNLAEELIRNSPPILTQVWLTTKAEITANPPGNIWIRPVDYRDSLPRLMFDSNRRPPRSVYRRNTSRDIFVEQNVPKHALLAFEAATEAPRSATRT